MLVDPHMVVKADAPLKPERASPLRHPRVERKNDVDHSEEHDQEGRNQGQGDSRKPKAKDSEVDRYI